MTDGTPAPPRRLDRDFLVLILVLLVVNLPTFRVEFLPLHDSLQVFQIYHFQYCNLVFNAEYAEWLPFCAFGMPSDYWNLVAITPAGYFTMLVGGLLGVRDFLLLFKLSVLLEQLFFLFGVYQLARLLFVRRSTVYFVCLGAILSVDWQTQIWWTFRIYYLVPLGLFLLLLFFERRQSRYFWLAGVVFVGSLIGNLPYFAPLYLFLCSPIVLFLGWRQRHQWRGFMRWGRPDAACLMLFALVSACYLITASRAMDHLAHTVETGRSRATGTATLESFLAYGGHPSVDHLIQLFIVGWPIRGYWSGYPDQTLYVGLLPLVLLLWSVFHVRDVRYLAFITLAGLLLWLSAGGAFSLLAYGLPTMWWFRHVGLLYPLLKIVVLLCSGFGFDHLAATARRRDFWCAALGLVFAADIATNYLYLPLHIHLPRIGAIQRPQGIELFGVRVLLYVSACGLILYRDWRDRNTAGEHHGRLRCLGFATAVLLTCYVADLVLFQALLFSSEPRPEADPGLPKALEAAPFSFTYQRTSSPDNDRARAGAKWMEWAIQNPSRVYEVAQGHLHWDSCGSPYYTPHMSSRVYALTQAIPHPPRFDFDIVGQPRELNVEPNVVFGCQFPKLRLVPQAIFVDGASAALEASCRVDPKQTVVIDGQVEPVPPRGKPMSENVPANTIRVTGFTANTIELEADVAAEHAWLVYADAFHPDWQVTVNGQEAQLAPAYHAFKAVRLARGANHVVMSFRSYGTRNQILAAIGVGFSSSLLIALVLFLLRLSPAYKTPDRSVTDPQEAHSSNAQPLGTVCDSVGVGVGSDDGRSADI